MARSTWTAARTLGESAAVDYYKEALTIKSGAKTVSLSGVLDSSQDRTNRTASPDGTFPVLALLSCWRSELGFLPTVNEAIRIARTAKPTEEQVYLVLSVDQTSDLLTIELQAHSNNATPFL